MTGYAGFLRGINVGGNKSFKMDVLKALCTKLGLENVQTYLQSGNVVFSTDRKDTEALAREIESAIEKTVGFPARVILRTKADLKKIVAKNPFGGDREPGKLLVQFLSGDLSAAGKAMLEKHPGPEEIRIAGRDVYIYFPNGSGQSKLAAQLTEKKLGAAPTGRNWNTVTKLLELLEAM